MQRDFRPDLMPVTSFESSRHFIYVVWMSILILISLSSTPVTSFSPIHTISIPTRTISSPSRRWAVAKTGGKVIQDSDEFTSLVLNKTEKPVLVFFTASWCGPCRLTVPVVKEVMKQFAERLDIVEVCTDDLPDVASLSNVVSIPTIQLYNDGEIMDTIVGCVAQSVLSSSVDKVLEEIAQIEKRKT